MLCLPGVDYKSYRSRFGRGQSLPDLRCPDPACEKRLRGHGWYRRYIDGEYAEIRRVRCERCGVTHALLPEEVCAYRDLTLRTLEIILETEGGPSVRAAASAQRRSAGVRRVRRWLREIEGSLAGRLQALLPAVSGSWWQRVKRILGAAPGALVRLRHWLWSTRRYFFAGLLGLFRHGRPPSAIRGGSTEVGRYPSG